MKKKLEDWHIDDPKGKSIEEVRNIASHIENKIVECQGELANKSS